MFCWHCAEKLAEDATFCPACGSVALRPPEEPARRELVEQEIHSLLTQANLFRLRKDWASATLRCTEALRMNPGSAAAHAMIGDICQDEGRLRDAMEWYKLALTIDPSRRLDREKLDYLVDRVYGAPLKTTDPGAASDLAGEPSPAKKVPRKYAKFGALGVAMMGFILVSVFFGYYNSLPKPASRSRRPSQRAAQASVKSQQAAVEAAKAAPPADQAAPVTAPEQHAPTHPDSASEADLGSREEKLADALGQVLSPEEKMSVSGVRIDPRTEAAEIVFLLSEPQGAADIKQHLLETGLRLGKEAVQQDAALKTVTLRGYLQQAGEHEARQELAFVGDATADSLQAHSSTDTAGPTEQVFSSTWWAASLTATPQ